MGGGEEFAADLHDGHLFGLVELFEIGQLYFLKTGHEVDDGVHISFPFDLEFIEMTEKESKIFN